MSKYLFIVESPGKCGKIKSILGDDYSVVASVGHIREIPKKGMNIDIKGGTFEPTYQVSDDKKDVVRNIKAEAEKAEKIYLASDPDREGSSISYALYDILNEKCKKKCTRVMYSEINKAAILKAIKEETKIEAHMPLINAAKARQVLDRIIGFSASPVLWYTAGIAGSSAGRVQSVALKIVCDRQKEIDAFKPEDYWFIEALLACKKGEFMSKVVTKDKDNKYTVEKVAQDDLEALKKATYAINKIDRAEKKNNPNPPFDTNSLQVSCSNVFGWSLSKSQTIAQKLYEAGLVTYIRTDSFNISAEAMDEVRKHIKETESAAYLPSAPQVYTKKSGAAAQEAHECIRPSHVSDNGDNIDENDEKKMYKLIRDRFIASQMTQQIINTVVYDIKASTGHTLIARGQTIKFDGWAKVYKYSKTKDEVLPEADDKESLTLKKIDKTKHTTQPPARYNEGSLAKAMEKEGVGRPATRASIITSIQKKGYVGKEKGAKGLVATILGMRICDFLQPNFKDFFMDIKYTSTLEEELDEIANGKKTYIEVVKTVYDILKKHIKDIEKNSPEKNKGDKNMGAKCPVCGEGEVVEKAGRFGKFLTCSAYPKCKSTFVQADDGTFKIKEKKEVKSTGRKCPDCAKAGRDGEMLERKNKSTGSVFYGCSKWPACKHSEKGEGDTSSPKKYTKKPVVKEEDTSTDDGGGLDLSIDGDNE